MTVRDILELGRLGYKKSEIEEMRKQEPADTAKLEDKIAELEGELKALTEQTQKAAARETVSDSGSDSSIPNANHVIDDALRKLVESNG